MVFVIHATYVLSVTNFGDYLSLALLPWYAAPKVLLLRFLYHFQESSCTSVLNSTACPETHKTNISLKAVELSASTLVCCDQRLSAMLMHTYQLLLKFWYSSTFSRGVHEATLTEKDVASTHTGSIVVSLLVSLICMRFILVQWAKVLHTCQQRSYVCAICSEMAPTHMSSPPSH